jgi:hypothetical protein
MEMRSPLGERLYHFRFLYVVATALPATPKHREGGCRRAGVGTAQNASAQRGGYSRELKEINRSKRRKPSIGIHTKFRLCSLRYLL